METIQDAWYDALRDWDDWWITVTEYANCEGNYELPRDFYTLNDRVCNFIRDKAERDITPFAEIGNLVKRHAGVVTRNSDFRRDPDPYATIPALHDAIWRSLPAKNDYVDRLCAGVKGRPPAATISTIPPEYRTKAMSKQQAAKLLGRPNPDSGVKWLNQCIEDGTISCETLSRLSHVFDTRQFPEPIARHFLPD